MEVTRQEPTTQNAAADNIVVSFVLLNFQTPHLLRLALKNLLALPLEIPHEIIVIDNNSQDGSASMVKERYPDVRLISSDENTGHAKGNNMGIEVANGKYICMLNCDIIVQDAETITRMVEYMDANQHIGILGPQLRNADDSIQNSCFRKYGALTPIYRRTPLGNLAFAKTDLHRHLMVDFDHKSTQSVDWLLGASLFIRKSALDAVGYLSESFFLYFADFELCDRMRHYGFDVVYYPEVYMVHYHRRESAQRSIWGGLGSLLNYATRVHLKDWLTYKRIVKSGYEHNPKLQSNKESSSEITSKS